MADPWETEGFNNSYRVAPGNIYVHGGYMDKESYNMGLLMEEIIEECPQRIIRAHVVLRPPGSIPPSVFVKFSSRANMDGMVEWLLAKLQQWCIEKTGKTGTFAVEEGIGLHQREITIRGQAA